MSDGGRLLAELRRRARGRARVPIDRVWSAFRDVVRGYTGSAEARAHLAGLLRGLGDGGALTLPKSKARWDRSAEPPLPAWVALSSIAPDAAPALDHRSVPWPPELAFVLELPRAPLIDELLAVRRFLAEGGRARIEVPLAERSLELFGDEKRLAELRKTSLFEPGRLSLSLLRCYDVPPPLVCELGPEGSYGRPILVLENLDSYDSFCRWNDVAGVYSAVAYGHGSEFYATVRDLPRVCDATGTTRVDYFGDLDVRGLEIPYGAATTLRIEAPDLELRPATRWYVELLEHRERAQIAEGGGLHPSSALLGWLPPPVRDAGSALLLAGRRLPQEHIGLERLLVLHREEP